MSMFKGAKPSAQPRSLRSIAESKGTTMAGGDGVQDGETVLPGGEYKEMPPGISNGSATRSPGAADKQPFANMKKV